MANGTFRVGHNVEASLNGTTLTLVVNLSDRTYGESKSGKNQIIASTLGSVAIAPGMKLGLNIFAKE